MDMEFDPLKLKKRIEDNEACTFMSVWGVGLVLMIQSTRSLGTCKCPRQSRASDLLLVVSSWSGMAIRYWVYHVPVIHSRLNTIYLFLHTCSLNNIYRIYLLLSITAGLNRVSLCWYYYIYVINTSSYGITS